MHHTRLTPAALALRIHFIPDGMRDKGAKNIHVLLHMHT